MKRKDIIITDSIIQALFILLKEKELSEISITDLVAKAGVSRSSFYRNFNSFENVIYSYFMDKTQSWWKENEQAFLYGEKEVEISVFEHLLTMKEEILLVYQKGLYYPFEKHVFDCAKGGRSLIDKEQAYLTARVSGIICGLVNEWIRRGMTDPPAYVAGFLRRRTDYKAGE